MKRIISLILTLALAISYMQAVHAGSYDVTADEVKEMFESRMLLSKQDVCDKILNAEVADFENPLAEHKKVSELIDADKALIYTASPLDDDFEYYDIYCIHAWKTDEDREKWQNLMYIEIPVELVEKGKSDHPAFYTTYYWNNNGYVESGANMWGFPVAETDYERVAKIINQENDKGKITSVYYDPIYYLMATVDGVDYRVLEEGTYFMHGLHTVEEVAKASVAEMEQGESEFQEWLDKKRALTPNLSEVERETVDCEPTHYLDEYINAAAPFEDLADSGKRMVAAVALLKDKGIISGYEDNTFRPEGTLTRGEAAAILAKLVRGEYNTVSDFPDTENHWSKEAVNYLVSADIIHGYEDGLFRPDKEISYSEAINLVLSIMGYNGVLFMGRDTIDIAMNEGFLDGLKSFADNSPISRLDFARLIANAFDINMRSECVAFEAMGTAFLLNGDITLGQYVDGQEPVNGYIFHTAKARQEWEWAYEDEFLELYDSILRDEVKQGILDAKAKRQ